MKGELAGAGLEKEANMSDGRDEFKTRLSRLLRRHKALARGYTATMRPDGLIVLEPRRIQFKLPVRGFVLLMAVFMTFKGFMLTSLGHAPYDARLTILEGGTLYEQVGAFVMGVDPVSRAIADLLALII